MKSSQTPNILLMIADQMRFDCLSAVGHPVVRTPNLDRLAQDGVLFTSAHCGTMACGPARASIFTGLHADEHGMQSNSHEFFDPDRPVLVERLREVGYDTALVGKLHLKPFHRHFGFRYFLRHDAPYTNYLPEEAYESAYVAYLAGAAFGGRRDEVIRRFTEDESCLDTDERRFILGTNIAGQPEHHEAAWAVREAMRYLTQERDRTRPFFLCVGFYGPHQPYLCPPPWDLSLYPPAGLPLPRGFDNPVDDKPILMASPALERRTRREARGWTLETYREVLSAYYGYVAWIDHCVGRLLDFMRERGLYDETLVIFTADHGDMGGQYRLFYKGLPYEGSTHVPLIVRDPRGRAIGCLGCEVSNMDVFATCLTAAGAEVPPDVDSRDLAPLAAGEFQGWDNRARYKKRNTSFIVRDGLKLIRGNLAGRTVYELYDLRSDPLEAVNLARQRDWAPRLEALRRELDPWHEGLDRVSCTGRRVGTGAIPGWAEGA